METDYKTIIVELADNVATVTLNRPDKYNCFNHDMIVDFGRFYDEVRADDEVRAIVLRAAQGKAFCTGVDVRNGWRAAGDTPSPFNYGDPGDYLGPKTNQVWKPFIVAVHGMAAGGAFYFLNESDITICSADAQFFDPHLKFGKLSSVEPIGALGRIPYQEISRMVLMADRERISAETALRISLVTEITDNESLWARADEIACDIALQDPVATQGSIKALWEAQSLPREQAVRSAVKFVQVSKSVAAPEIPKSIKANPWKLR